MKKVLFVCRGNVGRSQVANGLYKELYNGQSESAGTRVDLPGQKLKDRSGAVNAIESMKQINIDISNSKLTQLTESMINNFDKIVVMAEEETIPKYLKESHKFEFWNVEDMKGQDLPKTNQLRDQIKQLIEARLL